MESDTLPRARDPQGSPVPIAGAVRRFKPTELPPMTTIAVNASNPTLDLAAFEIMSRHAAMMARSTVIPESLRTKADATGKREPLDPSAIEANCMFVVQHAVRWGLDPYAVVEHASVIDGKICYEAKIVNAVLEKTFGIKLRYVYAGDGVALRITVTGPVDGRDETIDGQLSDWKTEHEAWSRPSDHRIMMAYRGARTWARLYAPGAMLGVWTTDELRGSRRRAPEAVQAAAPVVPAIPPPAPSPIPPRAQVSAAVARMQKKMDDLRAGKPQPAPKTQIVRGEVRATKPKKKAGA